MDEQPGLSDEYRRASPWPIFVAVGLALSEVGVVLDIVPISVGGLLLLVGSVVGILKEAGYIESPWPLAIALGVVMVAVGGGLDLAYRDDIAFRGLAIAVAGVLVVVASIGGKLFEREQI